MLGNIIALLILIALVILFAWLTRRAWKARRAYIKWPGVVLAGLLTLLLALVAIVAARGMYILYKPYPVAEARVTIAGTPEQVARGEHIASVMCAACHSTNGELPLSGGNNLSADSGLPLGDIYPPNITPGGVIAGFTDDDIWRILRTGVDPHGKLTFMAGVPAGRLADEDAQAVIAYLRHSSPVDKQNPPANASLLLVLLAGGGLINIDAQSTIQPVTAPPRAVTAEYGNYMVSLLDCRGCHGPTLTGDAPPPSPPGAPNLTVILPKWSRDEFFTTMRTGVDSTGHQIRPPMPWKSIGKLDDVELEALYQYLHGLAPVVKK